MNEMDSWGNSNAWQHRDMTGFGFGNVGVSANRELKGITISGQAGQMAANKIFQPVFFFTFHLLLRSFILEPERLIFQWCFCSGSLGEKGHESTAAEHLGTWTQSGPYPPYVQSLGNVRFFLAAFQGIPLMSFSAHLAAPVKIQMISVLSMCIKYRGMTQK